MKLSRLILSLTIGTSLFAEEMPVMRKYKESETGLAYTFSQVYISGMSSFTAQPIFDKLSADTNQFKTFTFNKAWEFNYNYNQSLGTSGLDVFADATYVHADSFTSTPLSSVYEAFILNSGIINSSSNSVSSNNYPNGLISSLIAGPLSTAQTASTSFPSESVCNFKTHIDIASAQTGVSKRFFRTNNIDFSTFGGVDLAFITWENKLNVISDEAYTFQSNSESLSPLSTSGRFRFYGTGPLIGADVKVPFNKDFLRVNLMAEVSGLMGYRTTYYNSVAGNESGALVDNSNNSQQNRHQFVFVPTLRAEISLDVIIKNFMMTGGIHQQVYFQALTEMLGQGEIVHGGPFLKASYLF
jgi:hypothetical protein